MKAVVLGVVVAIASCSPSQETTVRSYNQAQGYSVSEPAGWSRQDDAGAAIYRGTGEQAKHTIVIRAVPRPSTLSGGNSATPERIEQQTRAAILLLPGARLEATNPVEDAVGPAEELAVTFKPRSGGGAMYQRRNVVIVGRSKVFQVFYTAPAGETVDAELLDAVVSSLREEA